MPGEWRLFAATALLTTGVAESEPACCEFLDRIRTESERVLEQALVEDDVAVGVRALYVTVLHDQVYRPDEALDSWFRMVSVTAERFGHTAADGYLYLATHLIAAGELDMARSLLKSELGGAAQLGHDSGLRSGALAGAHTAREINLVTGALFAGPGASWADLRLVGELRRGVAGRSFRRAGEESTWRRYGLDDEVVAGIAPSHGRVGVLEWVSDGIDTRAPVTVVDAEGSVASKTVPLPDVDLSRLAMRMRSRLSTWRVGRPGDPFGVTEWQVCQNWLNRLLGIHLAPDDIGECEMTTYADRTLVVHASSGGSTKAVAEFIAARLRVQGVVADVRGLDERPGLDGYDAVVLGSAVRSGALLPAAEHFVLQNTDALRVMPVWLFSLGVSPSLRGPVGHFLRAAVPSRIAGLCELIGPRDYHAFAGVVPRAGVSLLARVLLWICGGRYGDLRDWRAIDAWAADIARYLHGVVLAGGSAA